MPDSAVRKNYSVIVERERTQVLGRSKQIDSLVSSVPPGHAIKVPICSCSRSGEREIDRVSLLLKQRIRFWKRRLNYQTPRPSLLEHDLGDLPVSV
ncbi:MAG: hypothetical protein KF838_04935 [Phycisphaeraceae bacterium]|nr:MAG: hypothetical protein KF838_04935 [Phycisphaeraceae bacterium]